MRGFEFQELLAERFRETGKAGSQIVVIDVKTGVVSEIKDVEIETHLDADGSSTIWIKTEEL